VVVENGYDYNDHLGYHLLIVPNIKSDIENLLTEQGSIAISAYRIHDHDRDLLPYSKEERLKGLQSKLQKAAIKGTAERKSFRRNLVDFLYNYALWRTEMPNMSIKALVSITLDILNKNRVVSSMSSHAELASEISNSIKYSRAFYE
jgi:hypothetical protein